MQNDVTQFTAIIRNLSQYIGQFIVIKYGGHAISDAAGLHDFASNIVLLKQLGLKPIIIHGGGPQIDKILSRFAIPTRFEHGQRVTDKATMEVVEMVLTGMVSPRIVAAIQATGELAVGLSGHDADLIKADKLNPNQGDDCYTGRVAIISPAILHLLSESGITPVISPIGSGKGGDSYNINADSVAGEIANAMQAALLILLTDTAGVLDEQKNTIKGLTF